MRKSRKPPSGSLCEFSVGIEIEKGHAPRVLMCQEQATELFPIPMPFGSWACAKHADAARAKEADDDGDK